MRIVIIGGGVVGFSLADQLLRDKHDLSLVEVDPKLAALISDKLDMLILTGSGSSPSVLREAGIEQADMLLAVTPSDEVNLVACSIAAQYKVERRVARLRSQDYTDPAKSIDLEKLGVTAMIHPEKVLVDHILQYIDSPHALESANFEDGKILLRGYRVTEEMALCHKTPLTVRQEIAPDILLFAAINRGGQGIIPDGETVFQPGDLLYTLFPRRSLGRFLQLVGVEKKDKRKIIISGDSYSTAQMAEALDQTEHHVIVVDPDIEHAKQLASRLSHIEVLHGDCTDIDLLREININAASFFVGISDAAEYNMLSALLAKAEGAHEVIAITTDLHHDQLFRSIGIDHVLNPRLTTAREILEIIARGHIGAVVKFSDIDIEAVRFTVEPGCFIAGKKVIDVARKMKKGTIVAVIARDNRLLLPQAETVIEAHDHVILITLDKNLSSVSKMFRANTIFGKN